MLILIPNDAKQAWLKRNQERVKSILLLAIPDDTFSSFNNKNVLKHQFENFSTASNESLDKAYDRFQKLISQLEVHGAPISKEDINQNLRVYEDEMKRSSSSTSTSQNLAFLSSENTSSTNENTTCCKLHRGREEAALQLNERVKFSYDTMLLKERMKTIKEIMEESKDLKKDIKEEVAMKPKGRRHSKAVLKNHTRRSIGVDFFGNLKIMLNPQQKNDQMAEQDIPPPTITAMKIPIIRKGEYDIWSMRMRQYICHTDHNLWDVIVNGDLEEEPAPTGETSAPPAPKTAKQLAAKRNQERVKSILLLAIPDEYLLKFHNVADAKSL
ncbi:hypothetical protein Tco_0941687 [Tanacetum coccineum]|uniref:Uncharacterized protein n=1 Tax=Tanacetum coccineum TaxID=301880 RepID=A0ABQ5DU06_9ASTR